MRPEIMVYCARDIVPDNFNVAIQYQQDRDELEVTLTAPVTCSKFKINGFELMQGESHTVGLISERLVTAKSNLIKELEKLLENLRN